VLVIIGIDVTELEFSSSFAIFENALVIGRAAAKEFAGAEKTTAFFAWAAWSPPAAESVDAAIEPHSPFSFPEDVANEDQDEHEKQETRCRPSMCFLC
jgi:hypothetical protein